MRKPIKEIVADVRTAIGRNFRSASLIEAGDPDTLSLEDIILSKIIDGVRRILLSAPYSMLESGHQLTSVWEDDELETETVRHSDIFWNEPNFNSVSGYLTLPDDYLRMIVLKMSDWQRPVYRFSTTTEPGYEMMHSQFSGVRGTFAKPVCVNAWRPSGKVMEIYSCRSTDAQIESAIYVPEPKIVNVDGVETLDIPEQCLRPAIYMIAGLTLQTLGDQQAATLLEIANGFLN